MKRCRRRRIGLAATAAILGTLLTVRIAPQELLAARNVATSGDAGLLHYERAMVVANGAKSVIDPQPPSTGDRVRFEKLVTKINWPTGQDGTQKSLFADGPSAKEPTQGYSSQLIWWSVDLTKVAAVDVAINGKRIANPRGAKEAHTAIYRLGGQPIPGFTGGEGYFNWTIWPAGDFKFDFSVYDDAGNVIGTMRRTITVAPMPADAQNGVIDSRTKKKGPPGRTKPGMRR